MQGPAGGPAGPSAFQRARSFLGKLRARHNKLQTTMIGVVKRISSILASSEFEFIALPPLGVQAMWC